MKCKLFRGDSWHKVEQVANDWLATAPSTLKVHMSDTKVHSYEHLGHVRLDMILTLWYEGPN